MQYLFTIFLMNMEYHDVQVLDLGLLIPPNWRKSGKESYKFHTANQGQGQRMSSFLFGLGLDLLCSTCVWPIAFMYIGDTLQKKETECRGWMQALTGGCWGPKFNENKICWSKYVHTVISATKSLQKWTSRQFHGL